MGCFYCVVSRGSVPLTGFMLQVQLVKLCFLPCLAFVVALSMDAILEDGVRF